LYTFDVEAGGEYCGIVQISCQKFQLTEHNNEVSAEVEPIITFNKYVKPPTDAIWDTKMCKRIHVLHLEHENIRVMTLQSRSRPHFVHTQ